MLYYCNPVNIEYNYQFSKKEDGVYAFREAADPSLVEFKGKYYLFISMTLGFYTSENLIDWEFHEYQSNMPIYDYAPDVRVIDDHLYFSASRISKNCSFYKSSDPIKEGFTEIEGTFPFWDPNLFQDDDGKVYFYWGCSKSEPLYGLEMDKDTMLPIGERQELIHMNQDNLGFERVGENYIPHKTPEIIEATIQKYLSYYGPGKTLDDLTEKDRRMIVGMAGNNPCVEGAWMTKYNGKYYLQYAIPGTEFNTYGDAVYTSDSPLGPFTLAQSSPFSLKLGGFITGAGHGSTLLDINKNWWHTATMRISVNQQFERRIGLWKSGFDKDDVLFCDQRFGDWPIRADQKAWEDPDWMLLSFNKKTNASSGKNSNLITNENIRDWWVADTNTNEWIEIDLEDEYQVNAIQVNFADNFVKVDMAPDTEFFGEGREGRIIDSGKHTTRWLLEGSLDGENYFVIEDKTNGDSNAPHDFLYNVEGFNCRYIKLTVLQMPFDQNVCASTIRVFGQGNHLAPGKATGVNAHFETDLDLVVNWETEDVVGSVVMWGSSADKLYNSYLVYDQNEVSIGALVKNQSVYLRIDTFNETGITQGDVLTVKE